MTQYTISESIQINASKEKIWEVLTNPVYIKQWDDIPENYPGGHLQTGSLMDWEGFSRLEVTECIENEKLTLKMYLPKVNLKESEYDVKYQYIISDKNGLVHLSFIIGDFSPLPNPQDYLDSTVEFLKTSKAKIKELSEK